MPPGIPADLITRVATIVVEHCGHGFPRLDGSFSLEPKLARAVLLNFAPAIRALPPRQTKTPHHTSGWAAAEGGALPSYGQPIFSHVGSAHQHTGIGLDQNSLVAPEHVHAAENRMPLLNEFEAGL